MINVVVVEDKHPILRSIVRKIENYSPDLNVAGQFTDGHTALQAIKQLKPNLMFTDIRMPGMDGLKLIAEVTAHVPDTIFIIISGHEEFGYARQAIQLGVTEYLLKPVTEKSIRDILDKIVPSIIMNKQANEYRIISHTIKRLNSPLPTKYEDLCYESFFVMLICAGSFSKLLIDIANPLHDIWLRTELKALLRAQFPSLQPYWILDGESMNESVIVFSSNREQDIDFQAIANFIMGQLSNSNIPTTAVISGRVATLSKLKLEYQITRTALRRYLLFGQSSIIFAEDVKWHRPHNPLRTQVYDEQKLVSIFKSKKKRPFFMEIESMLHSWEMSGLTQNTVEDSLYQILHACSKSIVGKPSTDSDLKLELDEVISISKDYPSLLKNASFLFEAFFLQIENTEPNPKVVKDVMEQVDAYFQMHMSDEISVNDIADRVNLNISYLSREFKKYKGSTPIEYLTQLRINKAKQLLTDESDLKFKDIAPLVGFSNQYYFSRVFKFITGLTPTEYKSSRVKGAPPC